MSISNFEYKKMSVTCLGPVHITDEVGTVYSYQYLYDAGSRRVYFLNERLWVKFLYKHNLLAEFEELIKTRLRAGTLCEWVQEKGFKIEALGDAVTDYADVEVAQEILAANKMRLTEIVRTVHNVEGQPYIPGSSIKGALRTGLLFSLLLQEDRLRNAAWAEVSRIINDNRLRDKNSAFARLAQKLEIVLLHRLKIPKNEYSAELMPQASMNCSIMKGLSVSDSYSSGKTIPVIVQKREAVYIVKTGQVKTKNLTLFRECLPPGAHQHFSITLDKAVFGGIGITSAAELYWFAGLVNGTLTDVTKNSSACAKLMNDITVNNNLLDRITYKTDDDGNLTNEVANGGNFISWTPIGAANNGYQGTFDGNGKTISGLFFNDSQKSHVGLFDNIYGNNSECRCR